MAQTLVGFCQLKQCLKTWTLSLPEVPSVWWVETEQRAQGRADGRGGECLRIWTDIMAVLEAMQKKKKTYVCCLKFDPHHFL